jgi:hypothetical protein
VYWSPVLYCARVGGRDVMSVFSFHVHNIFIYFYLLFVLLTEGCSVAAEIDVIAIELIQKGLAGINMNR